VTLLLALLAGVLFPIVVIGVGRLAFPRQADGSLVRNAQGQVIGSKLIGQGFRGAGYFHPRPSAAGADGYDASGSSGLNLALTNEKLIETLRERARAYRADNGVPEDVALPADAVTTSASGLDPDISAANAALQVPRVARARGMSEQAVRDLVRAHTQASLLGILGEPRVNVLELNLALDGAAQ
jgi:K+-transporting ATPase ATPase C chain